VLGVAMLLFEKGHVFVSGVVMLLFERGHVFVFGVAMLREVMYLC
jgi:methanogenic corrinoid protein MtbC1